MAPKTVAWHVDVDESLPLGQGDLVFVTWGKTIDPSETTLRSDTHPVVGLRDAFDLHYWDTLGQVRERWGRMNVGLAVVLTEDCGMDKEFLVLARQHTDAGLSREEATQRAHEQAEPYFAAAEVWPVELLPKHMRADAESGALGYLPFRLGAVEPDDTRTYVVDLSRIATISWRAVHRRLATGDSKWVAWLQTAICRFFAARTIQLSAALAELFQQQVSTVEALTPGAGNPPRVRFRLHFANGETLDVEGNAPQSRDEQAPPDFIRPGLQSEE